jgi:hypothetical protein
VRLALFAEIVKGKSWTPATLKEIGGTHGVGETFLEETFSASTAPPEHRLHQKACQAVLKALLPESGTDIKGQMRSRQELLEASGYANRPSDFDDLIRILDPELRLITPTDPEGSSTEDQPITPGEQYYQLTHDYLVHSLRDWLTRKQRATIRGRADLLFAERYALWKMREGNKYLLSVLDLVIVLVLSSYRSRTPHQYIMILKSIQFHILKLILTLIFFSSAVILFGTTIDPNSSKFMGLPLIIDHTWISLCLLMLVSFMVLLYANFQIARTIAAFAKKTCIAMHFL